MFLLVVLWLTGSCLFSSTMLFLSVFFSNAPDCQSYALFLWLSFCRQASLSKASSVNLHADDPCRPKKWNFFSPLLSSPVVNNLLVSLFKPLLALLWFLSPLLCELVGSLGVTLHLKYLAGCTCRCAPSSWLEIQKGPKTESSLQPPRCAAYY